MLSCSADRPPAWLWGHAAECNTGSGETPVTESVDTGGKLPYDSTGRVLCRGPSAPVKVVANRWSVSDATARDEPVPRNTPRAPAHLLVPSRESTRQLLGLLGAEIPAEPQQQNQQECDRRWEMAPGSVFAG